MIVILVAGCSSKESSPEVSEGIPLTEAGAATLPISAATKDLEIVTAQPIREQSAMWETVGAKPEASTLAVTWTDSPYPGCGQVESAHLHETADSVVVQLLLPAVTATTECLAGGAGRQASIPLAAPLGTRKILEPQFAADGLTLE